MTPKKGKKVEELDISLRGDKFHLFRLKQLLQYLVQNKAEIKIYNNDDGHPLKYKANPQRGELGLHTLVADAINVSEDSARKLINGPLTLSQFITNTDRVHDLGNTLDDILISYGNSLNQNEKHILFRDINFRYSIYQNSVKPDSMLSSVNASKITSDFSPYFLVDNRKILKDSISGSLELFKSRLDWKYDLTHSSVINYKMNEYELIEYLRTHEKVSVKVLKHLHEFVDVYISKLDQFNPEEGFLPDYLDLSIICNPNRMKDSYTELITTLDELGINPNDTELVVRKEWRYEFLIIYNLQHKSFEEMSEKEIALLLLCNFELKAIDDIINEIMYTCRERIRFTVNTSNTHIPTKTNIADLSIDKVIEILLYYQIKLPLKEIFKVETNSILKTPLRMHADEHASDNYYTKPHLRYAMESILHKYLRENIIKHLHGDPSIFKYI